jgi:hypothetical protein
VFYAEFDGQRKKRVVVKVMGERLIARDAGGAAGTEVPPLINWTPWISSAQFLRGP